MKPERVQAQCLKPERVETQNLKSDRVQTRAKADRDEQPTCEIAHFPSCSRLTRTRSRARHRLSVASTPSMEENQGTSQE